MKSIIIYSTKHGSVEKVAKMLEAKLNGQVTLINVIKEKVPSLDQYHIVILGGSIYMSKIQKQLINYTTENLPILMKKRVGLFVCAGSPDVAARAKELESSFPPELFSHATAKEVLGHEICFEKLGFFEKLIMKMVKAKNSSEFHQDRIENFAKAISQI